MAKKIFFLVCFLFLSVNQIQAQTYINGIDANFPPFAYVNEKGEPDGFDIHALNWVAEKMNFKVEHRPTSWDGIIPALLAKKIDLVASGMAITPIREAQVSFTEPYWRSVKVFVAKNGSKLTPEEVFSEKVTVGVQRGTDEHDLLEKKKNEENLSYELRYYESIPLAINDLANGRIDAVGLSRDVAKDAISAGKPVVIIGPFTGETRTGVAVRKEDEELRKKLNEGYRLLMQDPYWEELKVKYIQK